MKKLNIIVGILSVFFIASGCEDKLNLVPSANVVNENMWNDPSDFKLAANAFYGDLQKHFEITHRDREADIVTPNSPDKISNSSYAIIVTETEFYDNYPWYVKMSTQYERLRAINYLFKNAEKFNDKDAIKQYLGEAFFFRAYLHWLIFRDYGAVHYVDHVLDVNDPVLSAPRDERDFYANKLIQDLDSAIANLTYEANLAEEDYGRISKEAAQALLAKFSLFEGTWQKYHNNNTSRCNNLMEIAIANSKSIMDENHFELFFDSRLGTESSYRYLFILENEKSNPYNITKAANKEYILRNRFDENLRVSSANISHTLQSSHYSPTLKMINMYLCADGLPIDKSPLFDKNTAYETFTSIYENRDPRMIQSLRIPTHYYWSYGANGRVNWTGDAADLKTATVADPTVGGGATMTGYLNWKWMTERNVPVYEEACDMPIIRLAEVYLTYAEALYERNGAITDAQLDESINKLRDRVGMVHLTNALVASNSLNMLQEIRRERTVELYAEGKRYDDLRRWKTAEVEMSEPILGARISGDYSSDKIKIQKIPPKYYSKPETEGRLTEDLFYIVEPASSRQFQQKNYLRPIPTSQIVLNPNLEQNPGWE
ncbi:RagB/SusD family nutrient uptake outer membrane protein [Saccharicrinis sp. FJH62]|uniref:RagB/SusD family nutrient uptake outer membrane protein n=1 Tax=Saccharicrinis sp. FJH62 TaxID=3344657 RepID=UPI0035D5230B